MGSGLNGGSQITGERREIMEKKVYTAPELTLLGEVEEITKGEGVRGNDDQWWFIRWGTDPTSG